MTLYKPRKSHQWWYRFYWSIKQRDGTRERFEIRRSARTSNKKKAQEVAQEHWRAIRLGHIHPLDEWPKPPKPEAPAPSLAEFADQFLDHARRHTKAGTARFYEECLTRIKTFGPLCNARLSDVMIGTLVEAYSRWRRGQKRGNSIATVNAELRTLRRLFYLAEEWVLIPKAPTIHELSGQKGRDRVIGFGEEAAYLKKATPNLYDLAVLAVDTGLRPDSEIFPLEWRNVCLESTAENRCGFIRISEGKTDSAARTVPLTPRAQAVLQGRRISANGSRYVFPGKRGSGHIVSVQRVHERAIRNAELAPFPFYIWRHTFGTRCAESGMDKFTLARLMGHSSPRVAERYYVHVTEKHVASGWQRFIDYHAERTIDAFPAESNKVH